MAVEEMTEEEKKDRERLKQLALVMIEERKKQLETRIATAKSELKSLETMTPENLTEAVLKKQKEEEKEGTPE